MYTRCNPITSIFQKTLLLKDSKCNAIMHRQLHSESLVIFSKIENKLKPLKRCFSRVPNNKDSNLNARNIEGIGLTSKSVPNKTFVIPKFPREMLQQQFDPTKNQELYPRNILNHNGVPDNSDKFPISINSSNQNSTGNGIITIVIDKSDICSSKSNNEDVTIHVTTVPKMSSKRLIETLSQADLVNICSAKCSCCQQCEEYKKIHSQRPNSMLLPTFNNGVNIFNSLPKRQQNLYGVPLRSMSMINEGFKSPEIHPQQIKRSRSMDNFQGMRKMVQQRQSNVGQSPQRLNEQRQKSKQRPRDLLVHSGRSQSRLIPSSNVYNKQKQLDASRAMGKNIVNKSMEQSYKNHPTRQRQPIHLAHRGRSANAVILSGKPQQNPHRERSQSRVNVSRDLNIRQNQLAIPSTTQSNLVTNQTKRRQQSISVQEGRSQNRPISSANHTKQQELSTPKKMDTNLRQRQVEPSQQNLLVQRGNFTNIQKQPAVAQTVERNLSSKQLESQQRGRSENRLPSGKPRNHQQLDLQQRIEPKLGLQQMKQRQQNPSFHTERSQNKLDLSGNKNQKQILPRTLKPNSEQSQRNSSLKRQSSQNQNSSGYSVPQQLSLRPLQAPRNLTRLPGESPNRNNLVGRRQQNAPLQSMAQRNQNMNDKDANKFNKRFNVQRQQSQNPINRVLRPLSLGPSNNRFWNDDRPVTNADNTRSINQLKNLSSIGSQKQRFFKLHPKETNPLPSVIQLGRKMTLINQLPILSKNKFPENRRSIPKMLNFANEYNSKVAFRDTAPNFSKKLRLGNPSLITPHPFGTTLRQNVLSKNNFVYNRAQVPSKQRNTLRAPFTKNDPYQKQVSAHIQYPRIVLTKRSVLGPAINSGTKNRQQQNFRLNKNFGNQLTPLYALKQQGPTIPSVRGPLSPQSRSRKQFLAQRQPPKLVVRKRSALRSEHNPQVNIFQQQNDFLVRNFLRQQIPTFARNQKGPILPRILGTSLMPAPMTMSFSQRNAYAQRYFPQQQLQAANVLQPATHRPGNLLIPFRKNISEQNFFYQKNFKPPSPTLSKRTHLAAPLVNYGQWQNISHPHNNFVHSTQRKLTIQDQGKKQNEIRRMNQEKRQSYLLQPAAHRPGNSLIPLRKNFFEQKSFYRKNFKPPSPTLSKRTHLAAPLVNYGQWQNISHLHNKFVHSTQGKLTIQDQGQKRNEIRRMNQEKLQSSLPVSANNQPSEIKKYVDPPKSLQTPIRPNSNLNIENTLKSNNTATPGNNIQSEKKTQLTKAYQNFINRFKLSSRRSKINRTTNKDNPDNGSSNASNVSDANPAVLFYAPGKLKLIDAPVPRLNDEKGVIVKMLYVHLTDADSQMLESVQDSPYKLTKPTVAGKSGSGVIVDVGKQVQNVKIGDKVSIKPVSCGKCSACQNNNALMCKRVPISDKFGILKKFHALPSKFVIKLPNKVNPIDGAMMGDLSSAIRACKKSCVTAGDNVLVVDAGSLGLWTALAAKSMGATNVCLADTREVVLEQAKKLGIDRLYLINPNAPISNTSTDISETMEGENPRIVFDCSGSTFSNQIAINTAKMGGKVVLMKNFGSNQPIVLSDAIHRGIDILSSQHGNDNSDHAALQFLASGKVQLNGIDSRFFDISNVNEAFQMLTSGTNSNIFIQLNRIDEEIIAKEKLKTS